MIAPQVLNYIMYDSYALSVSVWSFTAIYSAVKERKTFVKGYNSVNKKVRPMLYWLYALYIKIMLRSAYG